ncbi:MAG: FG-GAP-like repeat-containing protein [Candidatus Andersenbacteria bacterium]
MMPGPRLRIRRRFSLLQAVLPAVRFLSIIGLTASVLLGGYRYITRPQTAGALEFTPHIVGSETGAVGVLDFAARDMDGEGDMDIVTVGVDGVKIYVRTDSGDFEQNIIDDKSGYRVQIVELNGDSLPDLLVTLHGDNSLRWYRNNGNLEFSSFTIGSGADAVAYAGDIDADGAPDVVVASREGGVVVLRRWMNDGLGIFTSTELDADSKVSAVTIADLDGNGYQDFITGGLQGLQAWDTDDGTVWSRTDLDDANENRTWITAKDVNGDDRIDIVTGDQVEDTLAYYQNTQHTSYERAVIASTIDATTIRIIDLDEDGDEDFVVAAQDNNSVFWFDNDGTQTFSKQTLATNLQTVLSVAVVDLDGDNDFDFIAGDHYRGTVRWYERTRAKPTATKPSDMQQATDGSGRVTFETTVSDADRDSTRARIQYSFDGDHWYKPWLTQVKVDNGSVDLKNSNGYQVGTTNPIDTNLHASVKLTFTWDTKSAENTGGPVVGDIDSIQLRIIPRDAVGNGATATSSQFRVDNTAPVGAGGLKITAISDKEATLTWDKPTDSSAFGYEIYYGTNHAEVLEQRSARWDETNDAEMGDLETTSTTITDLNAGQSYTFKLFVTDQYGNSTAAPSVQGKAVIAPSPTPTPEPATSTPPTTSTTPVPTTSDVPSTSTAPTPAASASPLPTATPFISPTVTPPIFATPPPTTAQNTPPVADAGPDQIVNPSALVVLVGSASYDPDDDPLTYSWRQLSGPQVELLSERTANASFSAGGENETYIFSLMVRDPNGASAIDQVTVATKRLPQASTVPVAVGTTPVEPTDEGLSGTFAINLLKPFDIAFFALSLFATLMALGERVARAMRDKQGSGTRVSSAGTSKAQTGKVVHFKTGEPIVQAQVMVYGADGKLRATERTNMKGEFSSMFPAGEYMISVKVPGFTFSPAASRTIRPESGIVYSGGKLTVPEGSKPLEIVIPMKPTGAQVRSLPTRFLQLWQTMQRLGRILSWPIFIIGALINTVLIFVAPSGFYLFIEVLYVLLVIVKVALEIRVRPAYGLVRDAITHVPLDLAVVRLFEHGTNRVIMTRVTDGQGKFFALPPSGTYTVTVTKPGYAIFSKDKVDITSDQDSVLQITADLMPVVPNSGLQQARAAVL